MTWNTVELVVRPGPVQSENESEEVLDISWLSGATVERCGCWQWLKINTQDFDAGLQRAGPSQMNDARHWEAETTWSVVHARTSGTTFLLFSYIAKGYLAVVYYHISAL